MAANYKDGPFSILPNASILFNYLAKSKKHLNQKRKMKKEKIIKKKKIKRIKKNKTKYIT